MRLRGEKSIYDDFSLRSTMVYQAPFVWVARLTCKSWSETYGVVQTGISIDDPLMISVVSFSFGVAQSSIYTSVQLAIFDIDWNDSHYVGRPMKESCKSHRC